MSVNPPIQKQRKRIEQIQFVQNLHRPELSAMLPYQISFKLIYRIITFPCNPYCSSIIHHRHQLVQNETDIFGIHELDGDTVKSVKFNGGCNGNTQGVAALVKGMNVDEAISRLKGIDCGGRGTSCPDQLAKALEQMKTQNA